MADHQLVQCALQRRTVQGAAQLHAIRDVVRVARRLHLRQEPQPLLCERGQHIAPVRLRNRILLGCARLRHECGERRRQEQRGQRDVQSQLLAHTRDQTHAEQRVSAEIEEIVVATDPVDPEHLRPDTGNDLFDRRTRRFVFRPSAVRVALRRGQRLAIEFAVAGQRPRAHFHVRRRHHVVRQLQLQLRTQRIGRRRAFLCAFVVRHQSRRLIRHVLTRQHHRVLHARQRRQLRLDLAQLDPVTPDLHLEVVATAVFDQSVAAPAAQIARAVQPPAGRERTVDEALRRDLRTMQITARHARAADVQLADHARRRRLQILVQDVHLFVGKRPADRNRVRRIEVRRTQVGDADRRGLGRAIDVEEPPISIPALQQRRGYGFAAAGDRMHGRERHVLRHGRQQCRREEAMRGPLPRHQRLQRFAQQQIARLAQMQ